MQRQLVPGYTIAHSNFNVYADTHMHTHTCTLSSQMTDIRTYVHCLYLYLCYNTKYCLLEVDNWFTRTHKSHSPVKDERKYIES